MPRVFKLVSVALHAIVIGFVVLAQLLDVGPLPLPRDVLAFTDRRVTISDIPVPPPPTRRAAPDRLTPSVSPDTAPIVAPREITPETPIERTTPPASPFGVPGAIENGTGTIEGALPGATEPPPPPAPQPTAPVHLHQGIQAPRKVVNVDPIYPDLARIAHQEGVVILETIIDARGTVQTVRVLRGFPLLDQAAIDAVRQWRFTPALLNGQPVPVVMTVTVNFKLSR